MRPISTPSLDSYAGTPGIFAGPRPGRNILGWASARSMSSSCLRIGGPCGFQQFPAVDDEGRPGHERRADEVRNGVRDVLRRADAAKERLARPALGLLRLDRHRPGGDAANAD